MSIRTHLFLGALLAFAATPSFAQCGGSGHGSHSGHGSKPGHAQHEDSSPKITATNTLCPVMGRPVKPGRDREVVVGGNTYLVCCDGCGPEMAEHKEKYLDKDGKPLNAPKKEEAKSEPKPESKPEPASPEPHKH